MGLSVAIDANTPGILQAKNIGVVCRVLLQGISPIQGSKLGHLLHCKQTLYQVSHQRSPYIHTHTHTYMYNYYSKIHTPMNRVFIKVK